MKKIVLCLVALTVCSVSVKAQLGAPVNSQKDTFYIQSALYNSTELNRSDWPSLYVVEDATSIYVAGYEYVKGKVIYSSFSHTCDDERCYNDVYEFDYYATCNGKKSPVKIFKHKNDDGACVRRYVIDGYEFYVRKNKVTKDKKEPYDDIIFTVCETEPQFPGGLEALNNYISANIQYPQIARENNISGKVYVTFVVETDGSITNARVIRDIGGGCGTEAVRLVSSMPKWIPGEQRGKPVRVQFNLPVNFSLSK